MKILDRALAVCKLQRQRFPLWSLEWKWGVRRLEFDSAKYNAFLNRAFHESNCLSGMDYAFSNGPSRGRIVGPTGPLSLGVVICSMGCLLKMCCRFRHTFSAQRCWFPCRDPDWKCAGGFSERRTSQFACCSTGSLIKFCCRTSGAPGLSTKVFHNNSFQWKWDVGLSGLPSSELMICFAHAVRERVVGFPGLLGYKAFMF